MPKTRAWMADGRRYTQMFVADPSCCPSRAAMMTGRYPHNNGVQDQQDGPLFDGPHSMACYLRTAGYATYIAGKFLTTWPKTTLPPCFDRLDGDVGWLPQRRGAGRRGLPDGVRLLHHLPGQPRAGSTSPSALSGTAPFLLYETPQAPHWVNDHQPRRHHVEAGRPRHASTPRRTSGPAPACPRPTDPTSRPTCAR